jgi:hypothetical protein
MEGCGSIKERHLSYLDVQERLCGVDFELSLEGCIKVEGYVEDGQVHTGMVDPPGRVNNTIRSLENGTT